MDITNISTFLNNSVLSNTLSGDVGLQQFTIYKLTDSNVAAQDTTPCIHVQMLPDSEKCHFVQNTTDCSANSGFLPYLAFLFCDFDAGDRSFGVFICAIWLIYMFVILGTSADDFFCPALTVIAKVLGLSENLAGVTVLAFGNGAPDIFTSLAGVPQGQTELVYGELLGAGTFVTTVIAGTICVCRPFKLMERPFLRDTIFYIGASFWTFYIFYRGEVTTIEAIGFIILYVVYIVVVIGGRYINKRLKRSQGDANAVPAPVNEVPPPDARSVHDEVLKASSSGRTRRVSSCSFLDLALQQEWLNAMSSMAEEQGRFDVEKSQYLERRESMTPLLGNETVPEQQNLLKEMLIELYPINRTEWRHSRWYYKLAAIIKVPVTLVLKLLIPVVNFTAYKNGWSKLLNVVHCISTPLFMVFATRNAFHDLGNGFPLWGLVLIISLCLAVLLCVTSTQEVPPRYHNVFAFFGFFGSVVLIYIVANEIVNLLRAVGILFHLSDAVLGLSVLAWGNSIGDFIADLAIARQGYEKMGFSACFGGPLFNTLLGVGISFTMATIRSGNQKVTLTYGKVGPLLALFLGTSLASSLIAFPLMGFRATKGYGIFLLVLYSIFITLILLTEMDVISPLVT